LKTHRHTNRHAATQDIDTHTCFARLWGLWQFHQQWRPQLCGPKRCVSPHNIKVLYPTMDMAYTSGCEKTHFSKNPTVGTKRWKSRTHISTYLRLSPVQKIVGTCFYGHNYDHPTVSVTYPSKSSQYKNTHFHITVDYSCSYSLQTKCLSNTG